MRRAICDVERGERKFCKNDEEVIFNVYESMRQQCDIGVIQLIDVIANAMESSLGIECVEEALEDVS